MIDLSPFSNVALQFSGGKDSLACLYLLKDQLDNITVYHLDTGDMCPETQEVVEQVSQWVPNFVSVRSDVNSWRKENGFPSDLVPARAHILGVSYGMNPFQLSNRFDCCWNNLMKPMHDLMVDDGVDAVIRGTKLCDTGKVPAEGNVGPYTVILPIKDWTHERVFAYLKEVGAPENALYRFFKNISAPECFNCTAWWDDGKARYLKELHPEQYRVYLANLTSIASVVNSHLAELYTEMK